MDTKEIQLISNKILENFNSKYKNSLSLVFSACVEKVGFNKEKLIKAIVFYYSKKNLEALAGDSIIKKQLIKPLLQFDVNEGALVFKELIDYIIALDFGKEEIDYEKYKEQIVPNTGYVDYSMYKNLKFAHQNDVIDVLDVEFGIDNIGKIKLELDDDKASIIEPTEFIIPNIGSVTITFYYDRNSKDEFKEKIDKYIYGLKQIFKNSKKIIDSLYAASLKICDGWVDSDILNIDFIKKNTSIGLITISEDYIEMLSSVWDEETDEDYLAGHGIDMNIEPAELDNDNLEDEWGLNG